MKIVKTHLFNAREYSQFDFELFCIDNHISKKDIIKIDMDFKPCLSDYNLLEPNAIHLVYETEVAGLFRMREEGAFCHYDTIGFYDLPELDGLGIEQWYVKLGGALWDKFVNQHSNKRGDLRVLDLMYLIRDTGVTAQMITGKYMRGKYFDTEARGQVTDLFDLLDNKLDVGSV